MRKTIAIVLSVSIIVFALAGVMINLEETIRLAESGEIFNSIINTFSYYTNLTNLIVAIFFSFNIYFIVKGKKINQSLLSAVLINILIVGVGFNLLKGPDFNPEGVRLVASIMNHYYTPLATTIYYILFNVYVFDKKDIVIWISYPLLYYLYILIRGSYTAFYPY